MCLQPSPLLRYLQAAPSFSIDGMHTSPRSIICCLQALSWGKQAIHRVIACTPRKVKSQKSRQFVQAQLWTSKFFRKTLNGFLVGISGGV